MKNGPQREIWRKCWFGGSGGCKLAWFASRWWKDLLSLEAVVGSNWFNGKVERNVGNG